MHVNTSRTWSCRLAARRANRVVSEEIRMVGGSALEGRTHKTPPKNAFCLQGAAAFSSRCGGLNPFPAQIQNRLSGGHIARLERLPFESPRLFTLTIVFLCALRVQLLCAPLDFRDRE